MRDLVILFVHLIVTLARLAGPGGVRSVVAESVLVKHQLVILNRSRKRAPHLRVSERIVALCTFDASRAHHPLRNYTQAFDSVELAPRPEGTKVPPAVLTQASA